MSKNSVNLHGRRAHASPRFFAEIAITIAAILIAAGTAAQSYPSRTITWIVPFTPGGITDITSRLVAKNLTVDLGQQVIIENKPGAGGSVGTEQVARGLPDGHTLHSIGGQTDVMFDYAVSAGPHVKAGKLRGLAVAGSNRLALLPDVPTTVEAGVQGIESSSWSGVFVSSKTPASIVTRLTRAMELAMASADVTQYAERHGSRILTGLHGAKFSAFVEAEMARWGEVVRRAEVRLD